MMLFSFILFSFSSLCLSSPHISRGTEVEQKVQARCSCISQHVYVKGNLWRGPGPCQAKLWEKKMRHERMK